VSNITLVVAERPIERPAPGAPRPVFVVITIAPFAAREP